MLKNFSGKEKETTNYRHGPLICEGLVRRRKIGKCGGIKIWVLLEDPGFD